MHTKKIYTGSHSDSLIDRLSNSKIKLASKYFLTPLPAQVIRHEEFIRVFDFTGKIKINTDILRRLFRYTFMPAIMSRGIEHCSICVPSHSNLGDIRIC